MLTSSLDMWGGTGMGVAPVVIETSKSLSEWPPCSQVSASSAITSPTLKLISLPTLADVPGTFRKAMPSMVSAVARSALSIMAVTTVSSGAFAPSIVTISLDWWS